MMCSKHSITIVIKFPASFVATERTTLTQIVEWTGSSNNTVKGMLVKMR